MLELGDFKDYDSLLKGAVIISIVLLAVLVASVVIAYVVQKKDGSALYTTRELTIGAVCLASSFALSFLGVSLPYGGTITLASSLPIMIYCYYFGFKKGILVCTAFMLLQFLQSPYIVHPMSAVLDYVIPYLSLIFLGVFSFNRFGFMKEKTGLKRHTFFFVGAFVYLLVRYLSHVLSGGIFFYMYAWEGWHVWAYSFVYNLFVVADLAIAILAGSFCLASKAFNTFMTSSAYTLQNANAGKENN